MENPKMILFDYGQAPVNGAIVMDYRYKILHVNKEERWITIISDDDLYLEEPNAFINFVKKIQADVNGTIENVGDIQYRIIGDGYDFVYQWDSMFGITVIYSKEVTELQAIEFLSKYMSKF